MLHLPRGESQRIGNHGNARPRSWLVVLLTVAGAQLGAPAGYDWAVFKQILSRTLVRRLGVVIGYMIGELVDGCSAKREQRFGIFTPVCQVLEALHVSEGIM